MWENGREMLDILWRVTHSGGIMKCIDDDNLCSPNFIITCLHEQISSWEANCCSVAKKLPFLWMVLYFTLYWINQIQSSASHHIYPGAQLGWGKWCGCHKQQRLRSSKIGCNIKLKICYFCSQQVLLLNRWKEIQ